MHLALRAKLLRLGGALALLGSLAAAAPAAHAAPPPSLNAFSYHSVYWPGCAVYASGSNFQPGRTVLVRLVDPSWHQLDWKYATIDAGGHFRGVVLAPLYPWPSTAYVTADPSSGGQPAQATVTMCR